MGLGIGSCLYHWLCDPEQVTYPLYALVCTFIKGD